MAATTRMLRATRSFEDLTVGDTFADDGTSDRINALVDAGYLDELATPEPVDSGASSAPAGKARKVSSPDTATSDTDG